MGNAVGLQQLVLPQSTLLWWLEAYLVGESQAHWLSLTILNEWDLCEFVNLKALLIYNQVLLLVEIYAGPCQVDPMNFIGRSVTLFNEKHKSQDS